MSSKKKIICYYKVPTALKDMVTNLSITSSATRLLFSDEKLTTKIGYTSYTGLKLPWDNTLFVVDISCSFYFFDDQEMFKASYIKINNNKLTTPIIFYNKSTINSINNMPIGSITREILEDGLTRKITIEYNNYLLCS